MAIEGELRDWERSQSRALQHLAPGTGLARFSGIHDAVLLEAERGRDGHP